MKDNIDNLILLIIMLLSLIGTITLHFIVYYYYTAHNTKLAIMLSVAIVFLDLILVKLLLPFKHPKETK